jgi:hypothetical protein
MSPNILEIALMGELCGFVDAHPEQAAELLAVVGCQFGLLLAAAPPEIAATSRERIGVALDRLDARGGALVRQWMRIGEVLGQEITPHALDQSPDPADLAGGAASSPLELPALQYSSPVDA